MLRLTILLCLIHGIVPGTISVAASMARQRFQVRIPARLNVQAPRDEALQEAEPVAGEIRFTPQVWQVSTNTQTGATVVFSTEGCFQHAGDPTVQRDARLELMIVRERGAGQWTVTTATDTTNRRSGDDEAQVGLRSDQIGAADVGLSVTFIADDEDQLPGGDYTTTVVGTITAD